MLLMNADIPVLWFDNIEKNIIIINNEMLPLRLRNNIKNTEQCKSIAEALKNHDKLQTFFSNRVLDYSRKNAKSLLISIGNSQKPTEQERVKLAIKCRGLSVNDNFWVKDDKEQVTFSDVNIRNQTLSDKSFQICIKGIPFNVSANILAADISEKGTFPKTWVKKDDGLYLCKTDETFTKENTKAELTASKLLDEAGAYHICYNEYKHLGELCSLCKCMSDDKHSFVDAENIKEYVENHGMDFLCYIKQYFTSTFSNMVLTDYCLGNPGRTGNNWGFIIDSQTNQIEKMAPLFDFNRSLLVFESHTEDFFDKQIYAPTGMIMLESVQKWVPYSTLSFTQVSDKRIVKRFQAITK